MIEKDASENLLGVRSVAFAFTLPSIQPADEVVLAALYPPAKSHQDHMHDNNTSKAMIRGLGNNHFAWLDLCPQMPLGTCGSVDLRRLDRMALSTPIIVSNWIERVRQRSDGTHLIYVTGRTCNRAWRKYMPPGTCLDTTLGLWDYQGFGPVLLDYDHPTAHLLSGDATCFNRLIAVVRAWQKVHANVGDSTLSTRIHSQISTNHRVDLEASALALTAILGDGTRWPDQLSHLRSVQWANVDLTKLVATLGGPLLAAKILVHVPATHVHDEFTAAVGQIAHQYKIPTAKLHTFVCDGVAAALGDPVKQIGRAHV